MNKHLLGFLVMALVVSGCETGDDDKIQKARSCLDNAAKVAFTNAAQAQSDVAACSAQLGSVNTPEANRIRFGIFLIENQKLARIADFANAIKASAGTNRDGLTAGFPVLIVTNTTISQNGVNIAAGTGSTGIQTVASMIHVSTVMATSLGALNISASDTADQVYTKINNCAGGCSAAEKQALASAITTAQSSACADPSDNASTDSNNPCKILKDITNGSSDPATIVSNLATYLATNH
ncbi:MAG: hypothetical protein IT289_09060 [Oligoflexia bacterium]|nr:hypothetical protein [Oligoflexia bacterium]